MSSQSEDKLATVEELQSLYNCIGTFPKWPILYLHCKEKVVKLLDQKTRSNLLKCSQSDYELEDSIPIHVHSIQIVENRHQWANKIFQIHVRVQFSKSFHSQDRLSRTFPENKLEEAVKFGEKWMKKCRFRVEELSVEMLDYPTGISEIRSLPRCRKLRIRCGSEQMFEWWLQKMPDTLENLELIAPKTRNFEFSSEFLGLSHITNTQKLFIAGSAEITDQQFLSLKARSVEMEPTILSEKAMNEFLKRWTSGRSTFQCVVLSFKTLPSQEEVLQGLNVRQWDEEFEKERLVPCSKFREFWGSGPTFQVWSEVNMAESLTVCFIQNEVIIQSSSF